MSSMSLRNMGSPPVRFTRPRPSGSLRSSSGLNSSATFVGNCHVWHMRQRALQR